MMHRCVLFRYDSFKAAKRDLSPLFDRLPSTTVKSGQPFNEEQIDKQVGNYILHMSRRLQNSKYTSQRQSWTRMNASLVLSEARQRRHFLIAQAALRVILRETDHFPSLEPSWITDAFAACSTVEELRLLQQTLRQEVRALIEGDGAAGALEAREAAITAVVSKYSFLQSELGFTQQGEGVSRLGDVEEQMSSELAVPAEAEGEDRDELSGEERTAAALVSHAPRAAGEALLPPEVRGVAALRQLQRHRESLSVSPNQSFSRYFVRQGIVKDEGELQSLVRHMRERPTEIGVRVHGSHPHAAAAHVLLQRSTIKPAPFPVENAYVMNCGPEVPHSQLLADRQLLQSLTREGVVSYQSLSSMLPVYFLQVQEGERVLDLCAAPGGKSLMLLDDVRNKGCVVALEEDGGRAHRLADRLRQRSPCLSTLRCDGSRFGRQSHSLQPFQKVLVDAPCSGEGRLAREPLAWRLWHPRRSLEFFPRQLALLKQALEQCAVGGIVAYSTCTLNPIENEAVVAAVLRHGGASVRLVPPPPSPSLELDHGLSRWWVPTPSGAFYGSHEEAMRRQEESPEVLGVGATVWRDCFPPSEEEYQRIGRPLQDHCRRVLPHKTNGMEGFFIALLRKVAPVRFTPEENNRETSKRLSDAALEDRPRTSSVVQALLSGGGPSLFHQNGYVLLAAHNSILTTRLQPLFETIQRSGPSNAADTARRLSDFFRTNQVQAVWRNQEGLSLLSNETLEVLRSITDGGAGGKNHTTERYREHFSHASQQYNKNNFFLSHQELLQCGLVVLNASNQLTEAGANYLSAYLQHHKTEQYRRVIHLPLKYFQWLLSSQKLLFDASNNSMGDQQGNPIPDPEKSALYTASNKRLSHLIKDNNNEESWLSKLSAQLLSGSSHQTSNTSSHSIFIENAIVMLDGETLRHNNSKVLTAAQNWSFPVSVELTRNQSNGIDAIAIQLRLSEHSRRRYIAMLGRVLSAQSRKVNSHFALSDPLGSSHQNERLMKQHVQAYNDTPQQSRPSEVNHFGGIDGDQRSMADQSRVLYGNPTKGGEENGSIFEI